MPTGAAAGRTADFGGEPELAAEATPAAAPATAVRATAVTARTALPVAGVASCCLRRILTEERTATAVFERATSSTAACVALATSVAFPALVRAAAVTPPTRFPSGAAPAPPWEGS